MLDYTYKATFDDGAEFVQPADDESRLLPGEKSSKYDYMKMAHGRRLDKMVLRGARRVEVDHQQKTYAVDRKRVAPGESLPEGAEWIELRQGEEAHGPYFRRVRRFFDKEYVEVGVEIQYCVGIPGEKLFLAVR